MIKVRLRRQVLSELKHRDPTPVARCRAAVAVLYGGDVSLAIDGAIWLGDISMDVRVYDMLAGGWKVGEVLADSLICCRVRGDDTVEVVGGIGVGRIGDRVMLTAEDLAPPEKVWAACMGWLHD